MYVLLLVVVFLIKCPALGLSKKSNRRRSVERFKTLKLSMLLLYASKMSCCLSCEKLPTLILHVLTLGCLMTCFLLYFLFLILSIHFHVTCIESQRMYNQLCIVCSLHQIRLIICVELINYSSKCNWYKIGCTLWLHSLNLQVYRMESHQII